MIHSSMPGSFEHADFGGCDRCRGWSAGLLLAVFLATAAAPPSARAELPENPQLTVLSHDVSAWSKNSTVHVTWAGARAGEHALAGYSVSFDATDPAGPPLFARSWGDDPALLDQPFDVAVADDGTIYIVDTGHHHIRRFDAEGIQEVAWGGYGSAPGEFRGPSAVALDAFGAVYVSDTGNRRIQKFDPDGAFLHAWSIAAAASGEGVFLTGIAADGFWTVYAADYASHRVLAFDLEGGFQRQWGQGGQDPGELMNPFGLAVGETGQVHVVEAGNNRVQVFDPSGASLGVLGSGIGAGPGQMNFPRGVALGPEGAVYVADYFNHRVQIFDSDGAYRTQWGSSGPQAGQFDLPMGLAVDGAGTIYVADRRNHRIQAFEPSGRPDTVIDVSHAADPHFYSSSPLPDGVGNYFHLRTCDTAGKCSRTIHRGPFWIDTRTPTLPNVEISNPAPGAWSNATVLEAAWHGATDSESGVSHYLVTFDEADPAGPPVFVSSLGQGLVAPTGVALDDAGHVFVADSGNHRIRKLDATGELLLEWGDYGTEPGQLRNPRGLALDRSGGLYVVDAFNRRIQHFDDEGNVVDLWGTYGSGDGHFLSPEDVALDAAGFVFVVDSRTHRVQKFDGSGQFLLSWGSFGDADGRLSYPQGIAVAASGEVYVADTNNHRIQVFDGDGAFLRTWGTFGVSEGSFRYPRAVAIRDGKILVADSGNNRIQSFDPSGRLLFTWEAADDGPGGLDLPRGVATGPTGEIVVADTGNDRILLLAPPPPSGETLEIPHSLDPHSVSLELPETASGFLHVQPCDLAGNCAAVTDVGPFLIDTEPPGKPPAVASTSHTAGDPRGHPIIDMTWRSARDALSGVLGYIFEFTPSPVPACDRAPQLDADANRISSPPLDAGTWYFHLCAVDRGGNRSAAATAGPFLIVSRSD